VDKDISVTKMGEDIFIEYKNILEKHVQNALSKVEELKKQELFKINTNSSQQYHISGISFFILDKLTKQLEQQLNKKSAGIVKAQIKVEPINK
jgi:hypothetical protein